MVSAYTPRNRLNKQGTGDNTNTWGDVLNSGVFDLVDFAADGWTTIALTGAPRTLTSANGVADEARARTLKFTGSGGTVTIPSVEKSYLVWNAGSANVVVTTGGATTVTVEPNDMRLVLSDGVGVYELGFAGLSLKAYIDSAALSATGSLPAATGNEGKSLLVRSGVWTPSTILTTDVSGYAADRTADQALATATAIAFAVAL